MITLPLVSVAKTGQRTSFEFDCIVTFCMLVTGHLAKDLANKLQPELSFFVEFCQIFLPLYAAKWKRCLDLKASFQQRCWNR